MSASSSLMNDIQAAAKYSTHYSKAYNTIRCFSSQLTLNNSSKNVSRKVNMQSVKPYKLESIPNDPAYPQTIEPSGRALTEQ